MTTTTSIETGRQVSLSRASLAKLAIDISEIMTRPDSTRIPLHVRHELQQIINAVANLPGIQGALLLALDRKERPVAAVANGSAFWGPMLSKDLSEIRNIIRRQMKEHEYQVSAEEAAPDPPPHPATSFHELESEGTNAGFLALAYSIEGPHCRNLERVKDLKHLLAWAVRSIEQKARNCLLEAIADITTGELATSRFDPMDTSTEKAGYLFDTNRVLGKTLDAFRADQASLWFRNHGKMYLSEYCGAGLEPEVEDELIKNINSIIDTGSDEEKTAKNWVITSNPHLLETVDAQASRSLSAMISEQTANSILAAPLYIGEKINGLVFLSRVGHSRYFAHYEVDCLQYLCNVLGKHYSFLRWLQIARAMFQTDQEGICVSYYDPEQRIPKVAYANPGAIDLFQIEPQNLLQSNARDLYPKGEAERIRKAFLEARSQEKTSFSVDGVSLKRRRSQEYRFLDIVFRSLKAPLIKENIYYLVGIMRDVTNAHQESEQRRRLLELLQAKGMAYFRANSDGYTTETSPAEMDITGYDEHKLLGDPQHRNTGLHRRELYVNPRDREEFISEAIRMNGKLARDLRHLLREDGTDFWAEGDIRLIKDANDMTLGFEGLYRDVSERIKLQNFLDADTNRILKDRELIKKFEERAGFEIDYISSLGHQLQVPLASVVENLRNLERGIISREKLATRLDHIIGEVHICAVMTRTFAYMDRILSKSLSSKEIAEVRMLRLVKEVHNNFRHRIKAKNIRMVYAAGNLEKLLVVDGSTSLLRQVVNNLIDNAIKYSWNDTEIHITGEHRPEGRVFWISNEGFPVSDDLKEKIFHRGFRAPEAKASTPHGTGLGLWLVRMIVEAHGAKVACVNRCHGDENATAFRIVFPHPQRRHSWR